jgi:LysR family transcriptional regulator, regulator for genes of the gallate degradation pathway
LIEPLRDGEIDLLIGALRESAPGDDVVQVPLFEDQPVVIGRAGHPLAKARGITPDLLAAYPWTISAPGTPLRLLWERMFERAHLPPPVVPVECGSVITIRQILLDSDFLTLLSPDQIAVELEADPNRRPAGCAAPDHRDDDAHRVAADGHAAALRRRADQAGGGMIWAKSVVVVG